MKKLDLSVIILTGNEELHIRRCLDRICDVAREVFVIDCYSKDKTVEIAREYPNVTILQNKWVNYATQFNWALENAPVKTNWVLRLDADEYLSEELKSELREKLPILDENITGIVVPLQRVFMGKNINHGIAKGIKMLRFFRYGKAKSEVRQMDEHIELLEGESVEFKGSFSDDNLNNISWWTQKHLGYAVREAVDLLNIEYELSKSHDSDDVSKIDAQALAKRRKKYVYAKKPLFLRSFIYFLYRYVVKLGFLDGVEGFCWDFFQGWWYRTLVDAKIYEARKWLGANGFDYRNLSAEGKAALKGFIRDSWGISVD